MNSNQYYQKYHICPPHGWLNDPNGLCFFRGYYHVYFQYSPDNVFGGLKHWGHCYSKDFITWEFGDIAIMADCELDCNGAYSGSSIVIDEKMHIFYTGNVKREGKRSSNTIHIISEDGIHFSEKKVVLTNKDYPLWCGEHVRDPKVWEKDGRFYMVLGARGLDDIGRVLVYESLDLEEWNYRGEMSSSFPMGYMWECPDYFELGNGLYLSVSPQGLPTEEYHFNNVYQSGYFRWNTEEDRCECFIEWDMGFDFYAPQTFELPDQRRVMFGWMGMPDAEYGNPLTVKAGWQHCLTLPREITHRNDRLCQMPVKELESLRGERVELTELQCFDMGTTFELLCEGIDDQNDFELMLSKVLLVHYCATNQSMEISFADSISGGGRTIRKAIVFRLINIHVYADVSSVEIFINDGEFVFTTRYYPSEYGVRIMTKDCQCSCWKIRENLL